jgi:DNA-binding GntR family transcriptional regulator
MAYSREPSDRWEVELNLSAMPSDRNRVLVRAIPSRHARDLVRAAILDDPTTDLLSSESAVMQQTDAGRAVVRQALNALARSRLITRTRGVGTSIERPLPAIDITEYHGSRADNSETWIPEVHADVIAWDTVTAPPLLAEQMDVDVGEACLRIDYLTWWRGTPFAVSTHYIRSSEAARLERDNLRTDWYPFLRSAGIEVAETAVAWQAVSADELDAATLGVKVGEPVLASDGSAISADGAIFSVSFVRSRGDSVRVHSRQVLRS